MEQQSEQVFDVQKLRNDFSVLKQLIHGKPLIYLDSGATSLTPDVVVDEITKYYKEYNANIHRGVHVMSEKATELYDQAHEKVAKLINANPEEVIFTSGTTESLNLLSTVLAKKLNPGDEIVITQMEHHSNIVPWQQIAKDKGLILKFIEVNEDGFLDQQSIKECITDKTRIVSVTHMSNVLGTINDIKSLAEIAHANKAILIVDGAQSVPHMKIDVKELDCDFLCFSGHKMAGPTGIGVLYGKKELLENLDPFQFGGDMISEVTFEDSKWNELPWKFEAGTPNIAGGIALGKAAEYLMSLDLNKIKSYEEYLTDYALTKLSNVPGVKLFGPTNSKEKGGVISFTIDGTHAHDVATIFDRQGIAIRAGHMCAMPLVTRKLGVQSLNRISLYFYNTPEDIDKAIQAIQKVKEVFRL